MRVPGLLILLLAILAVHAVFLNEAFSANGYIQSTGDRPAEAFGSSQGGAQVQLMASRPAYYVAAVPSY
jgi:hypothetical protein